MSENHGAPRGAHAHLHNEICSAKTGLVNHRTGVGHARQQIAKLEQTLDKMDPKHVGLCRVPGYEDHAHCACHHREYTVADLVDMHRRGEMPMPALVGSHIFDMKRRVLQLRALVEDTETHNAVVEAELASLDPVSVVAAEVTGYKDPPHICRAAQEATGESPEPHGDDHA